jgi:hypothetical protein
MGRGSGKNVKEILKCVEFDYKKTAIKKAGKFISFL